MTENEQLYFYLIFFFLIKAFVLKNELFFNYQTFLRFSNFTREKYRIRECFQTPFSSDLLVLKGQRLQKQCF